MTAGSTGRFTAVLLEGSRLTARCNESKFGHDQKKVSSPFHDPQQKLINRHRSRGEGSMNVTFRQLRVFAEVAKLGSMSRAAETLRLTPQAISMQVREIELQVGLPLFDRTGRSVSLSTADEYFLVHARRLLACLQEADNAMARFKRLESGLLTIGIVSTAKYFVPSLLARFHEAHEGIDVRL